MLVYLSTAVPLADDTYEGEGASLLSHERTTGVALGEATESPWGRLQSRGSPVKVSPLQGRVLFPKQLYISSSTLKQVCDTFTRPYVDF